MCGIFQSQNVKSLKDRMRKCGGLLIPGLDPRWRNFSSRMLFPPSVDCPSRGCFAQLEFLAPPGTITATFFAVSFGPRRLARRPRPRSCNRRASTTPHPLNPPSLLMHRVVRPCWIFHERDGPTNCLGNSLPGNSFGGTILQVVSGGTKQPGERDQIAWAIVRGGIEGPFRVIKAWIVYKGLNNLDANCV